MFKIIFIFIFYFLYSNFSYAENNIINLVQFKKASYGKIIFVRHSLAPGNGDPINFKIDDCSTQRNLNKEGTNQALTLGKIFKKMGYFLKQFIQACGVDACKLQNIWMFVKLSHIKV